MTNSLQPPKILIIDDSEDNVALLRGLLEREGYKIETASDGLTGLEKVRTTDPDLILSDVMMPGLNGFQLTQRIRADKALSFIPIILITARNDNNDKIRALETGADDFLVKPIQRLELIARTRSLIRLKRTTDHLNDTAVEKEYLYKQAEQRALELATLNETSLGIGSKITLQELLKLVLAKSCELVKAQSGIVYLVNGEEGKLQIAAIHKIDYKYLGAGIMYGEGVAGLVAITQKPMRINNYYDWSGKASIFSNDSSITAVLGMPLIANGRTVGVLEILDDYRKHVFTDEDVRLLNLLAPQAAIALSNALLYEDVTRERDRLQALLNSVKDGILMLDRNYSVVLANQRFSELMELQSEQVTGHSIGEVADLLAEVLEAEPPFSSDNMNRILRDLTRNPEKGFTRKITITDPKLRNIEWSSSPVLDINREPIGWLNVFHDFTQQRELEQLREDFINMLVHDLKSPLTGVIGGIELADSLFSEEQQPDSEVPQQREFLQMASNNCHSMLTMVNTMLEVSRLEAGRMPLDMKLITIEDLVQASLADIELNAREKQINLRRKLPQESVWMKADLSQMKRVLVNLLANSIKFSPEGSDILVTVQVEQGFRRRGTTSSLESGHLRPSATQLLRERTDDPKKSILITVADEGPGIPPEDLGRIFNKFVQLPNSRGKIGSGLGLALCKLVIDAHGGRIWAESNYGQGSTFYISLPYTEYNNEQN